MSQDENLNVGLLDIDICGPSVPRILGLEGHDVHKSNTRWSPVYLEDNFAVMSIGAMIPSKDDLVIWRGKKGRTCPSNSSLQMSCGMNLITYSLILH